MSSVVRTRTFSSLSIVLFFVMVMMAAQRVMSSAGTLPTSNSYVIAGVADWPIDPYGACP